VLLKPLFITMHAAKHSRESAAKGDDQIAFENGVFSQEAGRYATALEWFADVKPAGGRWDVQACGERTSLLLALNRAEEAVAVGTQALTRMRYASVMLVVQTARALNVVQGPLPALNLCRRALRQAGFRQSQHLRFSAAGFASQCHQFGRSLHYLKCFFDCCDDSFGGDLFSDFDFSPLWQHLRDESLTEEEITTLRLLAGHKHRALVSGFRFALSFESIGHVPPQLRRLLRLDVQTMNWQLGTHATPEQGATFEVWCKAVRQEAQQSFEHALRKALENRSATSAECA
jgi:hypothetical protein